MKSKSNKEVEEAFKLIDKQFDTTQKKNKYLKYALMTPIHEKYPYAQNGITDTDSREIPVRTERNHCDDRIDGIRQNVHISQTNEATRMFV